ncbi:60s Acidic ribosomal protein [Dictyocaulus viviparus]|uniref:60s Acidic ribosomal protein n=1 Tax=Dictyocaulus viviparus TaxID=29172 RepID=A0A0D8XQZ1_DICVI|nr:60s Acidic ribosomal protein [Dictyocaulus viviparus]
MGMECFTESGGLDCDMDDANKVVEALAGKSLNETIEEGKKKLLSVPSTDANATTVSSSAAVPSTPQVEAKKEEPKEESDEDMGFGLFD